MGSVDLEDGELDTAEKQTDSKSDMSQQDKDVIDNEGNQASTSSTFCAENNKENNTQMDTQSDKCDQDNESLSPRSSVDDNASHYSVDFQNKEKLMSDDEFDMNSLIDVSC